MSRQWLSFYFAWMLVCGLAGGLLAQGAGGKADGDKTESGKDEKSGKGSKEDKADPEDKSAKDDKAATAPVEPKPAAPQYEELKGSPKLATDAALRSQVTKQVIEIFKGQAELAGNERTFDGYFAQYKFPEMTQLKNLSELPRLRSELIQNFHRKSEGAVHDRLVELTFTEMSKIVIGNFHPGVRYNAMLVIGELNASEKGKDGAAAFAYRKGLTFMLDQLNNANQIDSVRVAALLGILRHVEMDRQMADDRRLSPNNRVQVAARIKPLLTDEPPAERKPEGHAWMQRRAIDILVMLNAADDATIAALVKLAGDSKAPLHARSDAIAGLGRLTNASLQPAISQQQMKAAAPTAIKNAGSVVLYAVTAELQKFDQEAEKLKKKMGVGMPNGPRGLPGGGRPEGPMGIPGGAGGVVSSDLQLEIERVDFVRRKLSEIVNDITAGVKGSGGRDKDGLLVALGGDTSKGNAAAIVNAIDGVSAVIVGPSSSSKPAAGEKAVPSKLGIKEFQDALAPKLAALEQLCGAVEKPADSAKPKPKTPSDDEL